MSDDFLKLESFAGVLITQGDYKFYSAALPIDALAATCFVTTRDEDPEMGFQRMLDAKRAQEIADYIDNQNGTIPTSVILSAQPEANFDYVSRTKTLTFLNIPRAFLILDGQHRVYGFRKAKTNLRVPVIIYAGLSRSQESRLFIDINTKQRQVPNELLLDIKKLADAENEFETYAGALFDLFFKQSNSTLKGLMSPSTRSKGLLSRVTFNRAIKAIISKVQSNEPSSIYPVLNAYLQAVKWAIRDKELPENILISPISFGAFIMLFPDITAIVADKHNKHYSPDAFSLELAPIFEDLRKNQLNGNSAKQLYEQFSKSLKTKKLVL